MGIQKASLGKRSYTIKDRDRENNLLGVGTQKTLADKLTPTSKTDKWENILVLDTLKYLPGSVFMP